MHQEYRRIKVECEDLEWLSWVSKARSEVDYDKFRSNENCNATTCH